MSRQSNSATPSSGVSRRPSTAFDKISLTVVVKAYPSAGQPKLAGHHAEMMQSGLFARPQVELDDRLQVAAAESRVEPQMRRLTLGDIDDPLQPQPLRFVERFLDATQLHALRACQHSIHERQPCPIMPFLAEIIGMNKSRQASAHGSVTDQQHRVGINCFWIGIERQRNALGANAMLLGTDNFRERRTGARSFVECDAANPGPRNATEKSHAENRPA